MPEAINTDAASTETPTPKLFTQDQVNAFVAEGKRKATERFADYDDLKGKAQEFDALSERATKAEAEVASLPTKVAETLRTYLVGLHEIPDEDADLFLTAQDPETLLKQVQRLTARQGGVKPSGNHVPREGTPTASAADPAREAVRGLFG